MLPILIVPALALMLDAPGPAAAPSDEPLVDLVVQAGRPLRVALDRRTRVRGVGQLVSGTLVEPVYAHDRIVAPAGTKVLGHVARLQKVSRGTRLRAILRGDFTPLRHAILEFDSLVLEDCREIPIETEVQSAIERLTLRVKETPGKGLAARVREEAAGSAKRTVSAIRQRGRMARVKDALVGALPYHPQYLRAGTVYTAVLLSPVGFGTAVPMAAASPGTPPPPDSILHARLLTALDSARTPRGSPVQAVVTQPLFSADQRLILPEGTLLAGEVTFAKPARRLHRNGQLRFLFERVQVPERSAEALRASLHSVGAGWNERLAVDDEGGVTVTSSKKRFVAPALTTLAFGLTMHRRLDYDTDGLGPDVQYGTAESTGIGGFFGLGLLGTGLSQLSRPTAVGLGVLGIARTTYAAVFGKGREVSFPAHTIMEVQLGPEPSPAR